MRGKSCFKRILVPVDGSRSCLNAEELVAQIADNFGSRVTLVHVVPKISSRSRLKLRKRVPSSAISKISNEVKQVGLKIVRECEDFFEKKGLEVDSKVIEYEDPAVTILRVVKDEYDLVVMGNRGETEVEVFSLGSITEKVTRHAECSVLIVKKKTKLSKILIAIDGSKSADKALRCGIQLGKEHKAEVTLLNVVESKLIDLMPDVLQEVGEDVLSAAAAKVKGLKTDTRLEFGNPAETIIEIAEDEKFDLIVFGSRGHSKVKRFLLGSVSDDVSHHAKCSVLIVR